LKTVTTNAFKDGLRWAFFSLLPWLFISFVLSLFLSMIDENKHVKEREEAAEMERQLAKETSESTPKE